MGWFGLFGVTVHADGAMTATLSTINDALKAKVTATVTVPNRRSCLCEKLFSNAMYSRVPGTGTFFRQNEGRHVNI